MATVRLFCCVFTVLLRSQQCVETQWVKVPHTLAKIRENFNVKITI